MLQIETLANQEMVRDAESSFPDECCGFVFGEERGPDRMITKILVVNNAKEGDKKRRFVISPKDYLKAEQFADLNNLQLLGVYHSHPDHPAIPSEHDRVAAQPFFSYLILSVMSNSFHLMRSWRLNEESQFEEENIVDLPINIK